MLMQLLQALQQRQGQGGGMGSLPFPRPGMMMGGDQGQINSSIMSALGGSNPMMGGMGGEMPPPTTPGISSGIGMGRMPIMPRTGGTSPIQSLVRGHFANQPAMPRSQPMGGGMGGPALRPGMSSMPGLSAGRMPQYR